MFNGRLSDVVSLISAFPDEDSAENKGNGKKYRPIKTRAQERIGQAGRTARSANAFLQPIDKL